MTLVHWIGLGLLGWTVFWGGFGAYICNQKGRSEGEGIIFGALLGPLGLLIVALLPPPKPKVMQPPAVPYVHKPRRLIG
jgi:hypothetical protein